MRSTPIVLVLAVLLVALVLPGQAVAQYSYPEVNVTKLLSQSEINKGEWTTVTVTVTGDTRKQAQRVPVSLVLALDYSGSMADDDAYKDVAAAAKQIVTQLTPGVDQVAVITIGSTAEVKVPLTSNTSAVGGTIDGLSPGGLTNIQDAFIKANNLLIGVSSPAKMVILMSDGVPVSSSTGGFDWAQMNYINSNWQVPAANGIAYYTVGYGPDPNDMLLEFLAEHTGGDYSKSPTTQDLAKAFQQAFEVGSTTLSTRDIAITEVVAPSLRIRTGSLVRSITPVSDDPAKFDTDFAAAANTFYQTNVLAVPEIGSLRGGELFSFQFDVTSDSCNEGLDPTSVLVDDLAVNPATSLEASHVTYDAGLPTRSSKAIPQQTLTVEPCGLPVTKEFDPETKTVTLTLHNTYERSVTDVNVNEGLSPYFAVAEPSPPMPSSWDAEWLYWHFAEIGGNRDLTLRFEVDDMAAQQQAAPPYEVDHEEATVDYEVAALQFEILPTDPAFVTFETDLGQGTVSTSTAAFFAQFPDDPPEGYPRTFRLSAGSPISPFMPGQEFGWGLSGTIEYRDEDPPPPVTWSEPVDFFIKKTPQGYAVFRTEWRFTRIPQVMTTPDYNQ